jgi:hypothetical protein
MSGPRPAGWREGARSSGSSANGGPSALTKSCVRAYRNKVEALLAASISGRIITGHESRLTGTCRSPVAFASEAHSHGLRSSRRARQDCRTYSSRGNGPAVALKAAVSRRLKVRAPPRVGVDPLGGSAGASPHADDAHAQRRPGRTPRVALQTSPRGARRSARPRGRRRENGRPRVRPGAGCPRRCPRSRRARSVRAAATPDRRGHRDTVASGPVAQAVRAADS